MGDNACMSERDGLLDDEQMTRFLRDGFLILTPHELDANFHAAMFDAACEVHDEGRAIGGDSVHLQVIGDNLRARISHLERLLNCATVQGALASVLGEDFLLHPHHFVHEATTRDQSFHQDGNLPWNERAHYRTHRPNGAMLFYYPQQVTDASGPTEVLPGTQYWTTNFEKDDGTWHRGDAVDKHMPPGGLATDDLAARDRRIQAVVDRLGIDGQRRQRITVPAGSLVLAHYDLMHRGARASADFPGRRFMYKFYYYRTADPRRASWRNTAAEPLPGGSPSAVDDIVRHIWHWLRGDAEWQPAVRRADQIERIEQVAAEDERVPLAYEIGTLARRDAAVRAELARLLESNDEAVRRSMAYAIGTLGAASESIVLDALASEDPRVRRVAAYAAGEARLATPRAVEALFVRLAQDRDDLVRSNAAHALGNIARVPGAPVSAARLLARLDPAVEPDNSVNGGIPRSTVRVSVLQALANMTLADADLETLATAGLADHDRYVHGLAVAVLERHARVRGSAWMRVLVDHLAAARFSHRPPRPSTAAA